MSMATPTIHPAVLARGALLLTVLLPSCIGGPGEDSDTAAASFDTLYVSFETEEDIEAFYEQVNYSPQAWADGVREVPRMFTTEVSARWKERSPTDLSVLAKKRIFFRAMAPLALRSNELIREERERLMNLPPEGRLSNEDRAWLGDLARDYGLEAPAPTQEANARGERASHEAWGALMDELQVRVDEVPVSLVLAQAANESGWATSPFAGEGNALFGQWTFGGSGMLPNAQREALGDYRVAAFESPLMSVIAYMRNLNTHAAYARLRELRASARAAGQPLIGYELARGLDRYSERGQAYVDDLHSMIENNLLRDTDFTYLAPGPVYLVVPPDKMPKSEGSSTVPSGL
jgi:Bax protein